RLRHARLMSAKLAIDFEKLLSHHPQGLEEAALWIAAPVPMAAMHLAKRFLVRGDPQQPPHPPGVVDVLRAAQESGAQEVTITMRPERATDLKAQLSAQDLAADIETTAEASDAV